MWKDLEGSFNQRHRARDKDLESDEDQEEQEVVAAGEKAGKTLPGMILDTKLNTHTGIEDMYHPTVLWLATKRTLEEADSDVSSGDVDSENKHHTAISGRIKSSEDKGKVNSQRKKARLETLTSALIDIATPRLSDEGGTQILVTSSGNSVCTKILSYDFIWGLKLTDDLRLATV